MQTGWMHNTTLSTITMIINSSFPHSQKKNTHPHQHQPSTAASQPPVPPLPSKVVCRQAPYANRT